MNYGVIEEQCNLKKCVFCSNNSFPVLLIFSFIHSYFIVHSQEVTLHLISNITSFLMIFNSDGEIQQLFSSIDCYSPLLIANFLYKQLFYSIDSYLFYQQSFCSINIIFPLSIAILLSSQLFYSNVIYSVLLIAFLFYKCGKFELPSKYGNINPEKARKSRQVLFHGKTAYVWGLCYR